MKTRVLLLVLFAAGVALWPRGGLPLRGRWRAALAGRPDRDRLLRRADSLYAGLLREHPLPEGRVLRLHVTASILPALALYRALCESIPPEEARAVVGQALGRLVAPMRLPTGLLGRVLPPGGFVRAARASTRAVFPEPGFHLDPHPEGFDMTRCLYLDTLRRYGSPELTGVFCAADDVMMAGLPPTVRWERTGTLARGHARCDFRWRS